MFWRLILLFTSVTLFSSALILDHIYDIEDIYNDEYSDDDMLRGIREAIPSRQLRSDTTATTAAAFEPRTASDPSWLHMYVDDSYADDFSDDEGQAVPDQYQHRQLSSTGTPTADPTNSPTTTPSNAYNNTNITSTSATPTAAPTSATASKSSEEGISSWEIGIGIAILLAATICILVSILAIKISLDFYARHPREFHVDLDEESTAGMTLATDKASLLPPKPTHREEKSDRTTGIAMMDNHPHAIQLRNTAYHTPPPPNMGRHSADTGDFVQYEKYQRHRKQPTI